MGRRKHKETKESKETVVKTNEAYWWLETRWQEHHNTIRDIHPLLLEIENTAGTAYLTPAIVLKLLNAKNPRAEANKLRPEVEEP